MSTSEAQEYVVLLHGDETVWNTADEAARLKAYADHGEFSRLCEERGHRITGGAELRASTTSVVVRRPSLDAPPTISEGPFAETVEQLGGYYVIETSDLAGLAELTAMLIDHETGVVEIRPVVPSSEQPGADS